MKINMSAAEKGAKSKKEAKEEKVKDQKLEEQIQNEPTTAAAGTQEEKHAECDRVCRRLKQDMKAQEKRFETVLREKENLQREYNKSVLIRDKLQEVCREQQKIIKSMKNENLAKLREEEERRKESQLKFQASLNEINQSLSKNNEENLKLRDHNIEMTKKLKFLAEQYQVREQQLEKLNEQIQLESQLQQAKLNKVQVQSVMEKEILLKEKQNALERLQQTQTILKDLTDREQALKEQLHWYTSKYDDFQSSLQKSNDIFASYKVELEKLSKNTRKIEKESLEWKRKWEKSNAMLIELVTEKKDRDDHAARCTKQVEQLQKLLRALQHERTNLYKVLRENNIECPTLPELPPEPEPLKIVSTEPTKEKEDKEKMEMMSKNCAEIKQTLASLQSQIKSLKLKETEANALLKIEANTSKQQQQQEESLKKQQKRKKQKSKNKNKDVAGTGTGNVTATSEASAIVSLTSDEPNGDVDCNVHEKQEMLETSCTQNLNEIDEPKQEEQEQEQQQQQEQQQPQQEEGEEDIKSNDDDGNDFEIINEMDSSLVKIDSGDIDTKTELEVATDASTVESSNILLPPEINTDVPN